MNNREQLHLFATATGTILWLLSLGEALLLNANNSHDYSEPTLTLIVGFALIVIALLTSERFN